MGVFSLLFVIIINHNLMILAEDNPYSQCYTSKSNDSSYFASRNEQLATLADDVKTNAGVFRNLGAPYCLGICRKDIMYSDACHTCINTTVSEIIHSCPVQHAVVAWGVNADCIIHCLPPNSESNTTQPSTYACNTTTTTLTNRNLSLFDRALPQLTSKLAVKAGQEGSQSPYPFGFQRPQYFATQEAKVTDLLTIYAAGFCVSNLTKIQCTTCLKTAANISAVNCHGKQGAKVFTPTCVLRYELYPFYQNSASTISVAPVSPPTRKKRTNKFAVLFAVVAFVILLVFITGITTVLKRKTQCGNQKTDDKVGVDSIESCFEFSFKTVRVATNDFSESNKLGQGGFGVVYKGRLPNGRLVAVKRLTRATAHGNAEFKNEVQLVARLHHKNLVRLIGFCLGVKERILIYELALNGSLDHILFDQKRREQLTWNIRYNIIEGITRGLVYLHEESQLRIIHRDLKASNILLDESMNSKISDFGTARLFIEDQGSSASRIVGTYGYMSPEYAQYGKISTKVDVFSFGVLLLEIISGKKNSSSSANPKQIEHLLSKAWKCWTTGHHRELIDPILLQESGQTDDIVRCIHIGLLCVQEKVECRPTMSEVILMLEGCSQVLQPPTEPAYLMDIGSDRPTRMEEISVSNINDSDSDYPTHGQSSLSSRGFSSVNEVSFTCTYPGPR